MKKIPRIVIANLMMVIIVCFVVIVYNNRANEVYESAAVEGIEITANSMQEIAGSYFASEQQLVDTWAKHITANRMTMSFAIHFLNTTMTNEEATANIIWCDDLTGLSTGNDYPQEFENAVDYKKGGSILLHDYDVTARKVIEELDFANNGVHITSGYTNPATGTKVISFCQKLRLTHDAGIREAYLLYNIPVSSLPARWIFATGYSDSYVALIEIDGAYVLQPKSMKNSSFYEFIYSYNQDILPDNIRNLIDKNGNGSFVALDSRGVENRYAYALINGVPGYAVIVGTESDSLVKRQNNLPFVLIVVLSVILAFMVNIIHFRRESHKERQQLDIIVKQESQLRKALETAQNANRAKTVFLNNMSHDIRTPMNAIIGFNTLARKHLDDRKLTEEYLDKISLSSDHLLSLINDVLDMSRIESGRIELDNIETNLIGVVNDLKTIVQGDVDNKKLTLFTDTTKVNNANVYCDRIRLNQILLNLISNAIKFTPEGGTIGITLVEKPCAESDSSEYEFHVKDSGIGMKEDFVSRVFEPFERERTSTVSGIQGTGLGMAIAKNIVDKMGGSIQVISKEGVGTEFIVNVVFKLLVESDDIHELDESAENPDEEFEFDGIKVLLVEDNELNLEIATEVLEEAGFIVSTATDGTEAVEKMSAASAGDFDVILMDIQMPIMDGYEATKRIRALPDKDVANIPIIAVTANAFNEDKKSALDAGMNGYAAKPLDIPNLFETLKSVLIKQ